MLRITDIVKGSAAAKAGLEKGDMIVSINGRRVTMPEQLPRLVRGSNGVLDLKLKDYDSESGFKRMTINLGSYGGGGTKPPGGPSDLMQAQLEEYFVPHMGIHYRKVPYDNGTFGAQLTRDAAPGTPATQIRSASSPQLLRLERGDTIFEMDGQRFRTDDEVRNRSARDNHPIRRWPDGTDHCRLIHVAVISKRRHGAEVPATVARWRVRCKDRHSGARRDIRVSV